MSGKAWIRKKIWLLYLHPTPFVLIIFNVSSWLIQWNNMSKKGYSRIPWLFLRVSLIFFPAAGVSSGSNKKHGLHSCQLLCLVIGIIPFPCTNLESRWTATHHEPTGILCSGITRKCYMQLLWHGIAGGMYAVPIPSAHAHAPLSHGLSLGKPKFKGIITKNFKTATEL